MNNFSYSDELWHFGVKGMKWGVRRYQNEDGTLTPEGREHYLNKSKTALTRNGRIKANHILYSDGRKIVEKEVQNLLDMPANTKEEKAAKAKAQDEFFTRLNLFSDAMDLSVLRSQPKWYKQKLDEMIKTYGKDKVNEVKDFNYFKADHYTRAIIDEPYAVLQGKVANISGDWYWGEAKTEGRKEIKKQIDDVRSKIKKREQEIYDTTRKNVLKKAKRTDDPELVELSVLENVRDNISMDKTIKNLEARKKKLDSEITSVALKDIGLIDTDITRKFMDSVVRWD